MRLIKRVTLAVAMLFAVPLDAEAQPAQVWRIGLLTPGNSDPGSPRSAVFRQRLGDLGYIEGQNIVIEARSADEKLERLPGLALELVRLRVDVIVALTNPAIEAAKKATSSIPIVMVAASDPVASGWVSSLAWPGGNITGLTLQNVDLLSKTLQLLKEAIPSLSRVAVLRDRRARRSLGEVGAAAKLLGVQIHPVDVRDPGELDAAFAEAARFRAGAVLSTASNLVFDHRGRVAELAIKRRLPIVGSVPDYVEAGWFMSYGPSLTDQYKRAADFVDRILKGARAADLSIEQPTNFYLAVNLVTAKALGLIIPPHLLQRADQVIAP